VRDSKLLQLGNFNLRYFRLVSDSGVLNIYGREQDRRPSAVINFRDLISVADEGKPSSKDKECKWRHVFLLFTIERPYRLYAQTLKDKREWISRLSEIINLLHADHRRRLAQTNATKSQVHNDDEPARQSINRRQEENKVTTMTKLASEVRREGFDMST